MSSFFHMIAEHNRIETNIVYGKPLKGWRITGYGPFFQIGLDGHSNFLTIMTETPQNSSKWSICSTDHDKCLDLSIRSLQTQILGIESPCQTWFLTQIFWLFCLFWFTLNWAVYQVELLWSRGISIRCAKSESQGLLAVSLVVNFRFFCSSTLKNISKCMKSDSNDRGISG